MTQSTQDFLIFIGRFVFSLIFIFSGYQKILHFADTAAYMTGKGIFLSELWLTIATILELAGGILILLGLWTSLGALLIALFIIPVTLIFHPFWAVPSDAMTNQMNHFLKNLTILGACLYIFAFGAGRWSLDWLLNKKR